MVQLSDEIQEVELASLIGLEFEYSSDELVVVAQTLGFEYFTGVDETMWAEHSAGERKAAKATAQRSLVAHGVIELDDAGEPMVAPPHTVVFALGLAPGLAVVAQRATPAAVEQRRYYARPSFSVQHEHRYGHIHRFTLFETDKLFERMLEFLELDDRPEVEADGFDADLGVLLELERGVDVDELPALRDVPSARLFAKMLASRVATSEVGILHPQGDSVVGGEMRWVDGGEDGGLWAIDLLEGIMETGQERIHIAPTHAGDLVDRLLHLLPGGE
jgi:hypothetical protein